VAAAGTQSPDAIAQEKRVAIVSGPQESFRSAAHAVERELRQRGVDCLTLVEPAAGETSGQRSTARQIADWKPTLIAAGGPSAAMTALEAVGEIPVVFFMVPNVLDAPFLTEQPEWRKRLAGVPADVAPDEQFRWIARLQPTCRRLGVLFSGRTKRTLDALTLAGAKHHITVEGIDAERDELPRAIEALNQRGCDGVLMIPDSRVYGSMEVERLLLWGLRGKKPVWGFSAGTVKAGAFAGQFIEPERAGVDAADVIMRILNGATAESVGIKYAQSIRRVVNVHTAGMIGASLEPVRSDTGVERVGDRP